MPRQPYLDNTLSVCQDGTYAQLLKQCVTTLSTQKSDVKEIGHVLVGHSVLDDVGFERQARFVRRHKFHRKSKHAHRNRRGATSAPYRSKQSALGG